MIGEVKPGTAWDHVRCVKIETKLRHEDSEDGSFEELYMKRYEFLCDCGRTFHIWSDRFKGKRANRDCGECGLYTQDRIRSQHVVYMPSSLMSRVINRAKSEGVSTNHLLVQAIKAFMK
jgi:hypothetical protein